MTGIIVCISAAVMGVDYGWQPVGGGGIEYIIQIEPELVDSLKAGHDIFSDLPDSVQRIRSYRITVGTDNLPHQGESPPAVVPASGTSASESKRANRDRDSQEVDLSQLPGPVLGPALILPGEGDSQEPRHIAEATEEEPSRNQMAGYREAREREVVENNKEPANPNATSHSEKEETAEPTAAAPKKATAKKTVTEAHEPDSPSDKNPEKPSAASLRPELIQLGLFTSLCCNVFLLWVATGQRSRYRALVRRMFDGIGSDKSSTNATVAALPRWETLPKGDEERTSAKPGNAGN